MEIFDSRWEYFRVIFWGISPPNIAKEFGPKPTLNDIKGEITKELKGYSQNSKELKTISQNLNAIIAREEKRKDIIEQKAHSLLSISGITITLFAGGISILSSQLVEVKFWAIFSIYLFLIIPMINLVAATLLARRVVVLEYGIPGKSISEAIDLNISVDSVTETVLAIKIFEYINNIKGSFLKFAHWYYKATFVLLMLASVAIPTITFSHSLGINISTSDRVHDTINTETQDFHTRHNAVDQHNREINITNQITNQYIGDGPKSKVLEKTNVDSSLLD